MSEIEKVDRNALPDMVKYDEQGLVPAIIQDETDHTVLMVGYMNRTSLQITLESGHVTFWSRSRKKLWTKGETSGNYLQVKEIYTDCDHDALLIKAKAFGPTCHTNKRTCFSWMADPS
jgi:phosphoribosyl-AMP cyclohydrolase